MSGEEAGTGTGGPLHRSWILARLAAREFAMLVGACLLAVILIFLVVDFADRARLFRGPGWGAAALELYANKLLVVGYQLLPAALVLAAGLAASTLRKRNELTAMRALGMGPGALAGPVVAVTLAAAVAGALVWDRWGVSAAVRADEILVHRFGRYGDWGLYHRGRRWFREGNRIFELGAAEGDAFREVKIYDVDPSFRLVRRVDAERMERASAEGPDRWRLVGVVVRDFEGGKLAGERRASELPILPPGNGDAFRVRPGRPRDMRARSLARQIELRDRLGLPVREYVLELHNKVAYPLAAVPAALLALALALRPNRKGHLTAAIMEGLGVIFLLWVVGVTARSLALHGTVPSAAAAWFTPLGASLAAAVALRRAGLTV